MVHCIIILSCRELKMYSTVQHWSRFRSIVTWVELFMQTRHKYIPIGSTTASLLLTVCIKTPPMWQRAGSNVISNILAHE